jgi:SAM-dependent methyltransferase
MCNRAHRFGLALIFLVAICASLTAQNPEFDFYPEFRRWVQSLGAGERGSVGNVIEKYRAKLIAEGVATPEIDRRVTLLLTRRQDLENDFWNRFFTVEKPTFNTAPNAFLVSVAEGRQPGKALDVGMGEGRNALYLAKLGWQVTGFDPADKAVALAQKRAQSLGLKLSTVIALDKDFDFGKEQWDLILFSWVPPTASAARVVEALRPGGIVVVEAGRTWFPQNGLLKMFEPLRIVHYTDERAASDFYSRAEMNVVRLVAEKPRAVEPSRAAVPAADPR